MKKYISKLARLSPEQTKPDYYLYQDGTVRWGFNLPKEGTFGVAVDADTAKLGDIAKLKAKFLQLTETKDDQ